MTTGVGVKQKPYVRKKYGRVARRTRRTDALIPELAQLRRLPDGRQGGDPGGRRIRVLTGRKKLPAQGSGPEREGLRYTQVRSATGARAERGAGVIFPVFARMGFAGGRYGLGRVGLKRSYRIRAQQNFVTVRAGEAREHQQVTGPYDAEELHSAKVRKQYMQQVVKKKTAWLNRRRPKQVGLKRE